MVTLFSPKVRNKAKSSLSPLLFSIIVPKVLVSAIRQEEEIKNTQIEKKEITLFLFADDVIIIIYIGKSQRIDCNKN